MKGNTMVTILKPHRHATDGHVDISEENLPANADAGKPVEKPADKKGGGVELSEGGEGTGSGSGPGEGPNPTA